MSNERLRNGIMGTDAMTGEPTGVYADPINGSVFVGARGGKGWSRSCAVIAIAPNDARHLADVLNRAADEAERVKENANAH